MREIVGYSSRSNIGSVETGTRDSLVELHELLTFLETPKERSKSSNIYRLEGEGQLFVWIIDARERLLELTHCVSENSHQVVENSSDFTEKSSNPFGSLRNLCSTAYFESVSGPLSDVND